MKKIMLSALTTGFMLAGANSAVALEQGKPEFYVGLEAGHMNTNLKITDKDGKDDGFSLDGFVGGIFAGYTVDLNQVIFAGFELNANSGGAVLKSADYDDGSSGKLKAKEGLGAAFVLGYKPAVATKMYGLLGYKNTKFNLKVTENGSSEAESFKVDGVQVGGGGVVDLNENVAMRLEWTQTYYSKKFGAIKPTENLVQVGVLRKF